MTDQQLQNMIEFVWNSPRSYFPDALVDYNVETNQSYALMFRISCKFDAMGLSSLLSHYTKDESRFNSYIISDLNERFLESLFDQTVIDLKTESLADLIHAWGDTPIDDWLSKNHTRCWTGVKIHRIAVSYEINLVLDVFGLIDGDVDTWIDEYRQLMVLHKLSTFDEP